MIGYHYTTYNNWLKIQSEGMQPYEVYNREVLQAMCTDKLQGIWVWKNKLEGLSHKGQILAVATTKQDLKVALLKIVYDLEERITGPLGQNLVISHLGSFGSKNGDWNYHKEEQAILLKNPISPKNVELVKLYDLDTLLI